MAGNWGGKRQNAGRTRTKSSLSGGAVFAERILFKRIKDVKRDEKRNYKDAEEYAVDLLGAQDVRVRKETFMGLLAYAFGKPLQPIDHNPDNKPVEIHVRIHRVGGAKS